MRWADMDQLGHINNVVYVDYLQEARVDMMRAHGPTAEPGELAFSTVVVRRHEVTYAAPLHFGHRPVSIECWVTQIRAATFTVAYEVFHEDAEGLRQVYLRAKTVLTPYVFSTERPRRITDAERVMLSSFLEPEETTPRSPFPAERPETALHYPVHVRFSDVDVYGHVNNVKYFEYLQEARIPFLARLSEDVRTDADPGFVVAQIDVDYRLPILFRQAPYDCQSWISDVGSRSFTVEAVIRDGDDVLSRARVVLVFFDKDTQRSTEPPPAVREVLLAQLP